MKVKLLTDGEYTSMENVKLGTIFDAELVGRASNLVRISRSNLIAAGANPDTFIRTHLHFFIGSEVEILGDNK